MFLFGNNFFFHVSYMIYLFHSIDRGWRLNLGKPEVSQSHHQPFYVNMTYWLRRCSCQSQLLFAGSPAAVNVYWFSFSDILGAFVAAS